MRRRAPQSELGTRLRCRFAQKVRQFRREKGMTQNELACAAGIGREFVNRIESGRFSVTLETVAALSSALGISPGALIEPDN